jgi:hypothetical protein
LRERLAITWEEVRALSNNSEIDAEERESRVNTKLEAVKLAVMPMKLHDDVVYHHSQYLLSPPLSEYLLRLGSSSALQSRKKKKND